MIVNNNMLIKFKSKIIFFYHKIGSYVKLLKMKIVNGILREFLLNYRVAVKPAKK
jgi:hypothetical protein